MNRTALTLAAVAVLTLGLVTPAAAAPPVPAPVPTPGGYTPPIPATNWLTANANVTLPTCAQIASAPALVNSASTFVSRGDTSNITTHTGYGTQLSTGHTIIEDGGHSCTFWLAGTKRFFIVSVAAISVLDRAQITGLYSSVFGSTGYSIGGSNLIFAGYTGSIHEVGFLLEEGVWLTGSVTNDGDYFPAVLQNVANTVYELNN